MPDNKNKSSQHKFKKVALAPEKSVTAKKAEAAKPFKKEKKMSVKIAKKAEAEIEKELEAIYRNGDGSLPELADFEQKPSRSLARALAVLLSAGVFLGAAVWSVFFVFQPQSRFNENDVVLEITGAEQIFAGQLAHFRIRYRNAQNVSLSEADLAVRYPEGFVFKEASQIAVNEKNDEWALGVINQQTGGYLDIYGYLYGNFGQKQSLRVFLNYNSSNFSSEFQKVATFNSEIISSPVEMEVVSPTEIVAGAGVEFTVVLSQPQELVKNLALVMEPGDNFNKVSSTPASDQADQYQWSFAELSDRQEIKIRGTFNPSEDKTEVKFRLLGWKDGQRQEDGYLFSEKIITLAVLKTELSANLAINGSLADFAVKPGETLNTSLVLKNVGSVALKNMSVRLIFETPAFDGRSLLDWQKLQDAAAGVVSGEQVNEQTRRGIITWTAKQIKTLARLDPNKELNIDLAVPFKDAENTDLTQFTAFLSSVSVEVKYENGEGQKLISTNPLKLTVNSDLSFETRDVLSVNSRNKDAHKITWLLANNFHELKDLEISADLYGDFVWQEENLVVPAGTAKFDEQNKKLIWKVATMPTSVDVLALQFGVVLNSTNPSQTNLTSKVKISATDVITGQQIILAGEEILLNQ